jgi:hypothetical protein
MGRRMAMGTHSRLRKRILTAAAGLAAGLALLPLSAIAEDGLTALTCTNPVSGASWQITIDYRGPTVDTYPAEITRSEISWFDPKDGGNYRLDRASGDLKGSVASSTGGFFRRGHCTLEKSR